jgi:2',3'-cyclic-nucleotide 2'-phosphodiesterase (5'-nucleotidase family)
MNTLVRNLFGQRSLQSLVLAALMLTCFVGAAAQAARPAPAPSPSNQTAAPGENPVRSSETMIDSSISDDPSVSKMVAVYAPKVRELDTVVGNLRGELRKGGTGAGSMGNFVTDGMRAQASVRIGKPVTLALMNSGGLRRNTIGEGQLRARDIFELLPFENALITVDLTGAQLKNLLKMVVSGREAQSGAQIIYKNNADRSSEMESAKLRLPDGVKEIDPAATYTITTIDYLYRVAGPRYSILQEGKNIKELGITLRDAMMSYVKSETAAGRDIKPNLDGRFNLDRANSAPTEEGRP